MSKGYMAGDYAISATQATFRCDDQAYQRVFDRCEALEKENVQQFGARRVVQEGAKYHGVWLETQPMGGEMYIKRDMEAGFNNILVFMENQRRDGRLPGMIRYDAPWNGLSAHFDWMQGDFFTVPALRMAWHIDRDRGYLERLYATLRDFDAYLWSCRDSDGDGCLEVWCMWDTGDDNNSRYLVNRVSAIENGAWNGENAPCGVGKLPFESAEFMAYNYAQRSALAQISEWLDNGEAEMWRAKAEQVRARFIEYLWDDEHAFAFDRDGDNVKIDSISLENVKCMYQGIFTQEMADRFIREHLLNPDEFWTAMPLPNIAVNDPLFYLDDAHTNLSSENLKLFKEYSHGDVADNSWSGPVEGLSLQRSLLALMRYGHHAETGMIGRKFIDMLAKTDRYTQQYNPFTAQATAGGDGYGPTILAALEYMAYLYGVGFEEDKVVFSALDDARKTEYTQTIYGRAYAVRRENGRAAVYVDGKEAFSFTQGARVYASRDGVPERIVGLNETAIDMALTVGGETLTARLHPNEEMRVDGGRLMSVKRIDFAAE